MIKNKAIDTFHEIKINMKYVENVNRLFDKFDSTICNKYIICTMINKNIFIAVTTYASFPILGFPKQNDRRTRDHCRLKVIKTRVVLYTCIRQLVFYRITSFPFINRERRI